MVASGYGPNLIVQLLSGGCITRLLHILGNSEIRSKRALIISYHLSLSFSTARWGSRPLREKIKVVSIPAYAFSLVEVFTNNLLYWPDFELGNFVMF
ncbi:uncharacterized protein LOC126659999 isoform X3 [Mercurialis annua]|uniref:uncharacterized protein LOC126659999 isoform X3 n=1 Tax=Mercurialis annua TaxID=3986 RepID=UPI00215FC158|nr:uncharacterized protein LOC126659999 isoform X3 [Mercurialis annua]